jgi:hypothetical protein
MSELLYISPFQIIHNLHVDKVTFIGTRANRKKARCAGHTLFFALDCILGGGSHIILFYLIARPFDWTI